MKQCFVIYNQSKAAYVSGPNSLTKKVTQAQKYRSYNEAERLCCDGETVRRLR